MARISIYTSKELQAVVQTTKQLPKEVSSQLNRHTKGVAAPVWQQEVAQRASTRLESRVIAQTATVSVSRANVRLRAGTKGKALSRGGATPPEIVKAVEFGSSRGKTSTYPATSTKGRRFMVDDRHTRRQFKNQKRGGYVAYPAAANVIPRIAALWVQTVVRTVHEAFEK